MIPRTIFELITLLHTLDPDLPLYAYSKRWLEQDGNWMAPVVGVGTSFGVFDVEPPEGVTPELRPVALIVINDLPVPASEPKTKSDAET